MDKTHASMFDERKVAQAAAYLLEKAGGQMPVLKLMKLIYLSDREALDEYGFPITFDHMVSMPHGPVLSVTYDLANGSMPSAPGGWEDWVSDREAHDVALARQIQSRKDLDELSDTDIDILDVVWAKFGEMGKWAIRDYTHQHCPEWEDPNGSSYPITYEKVFRALGRDEAVAKELASHIEAERNLDKLFAAL